MGRSLIFLFILILPSCSYKIIRDYQLPEENKVNADCKPIIKENINLYGIQLKYLGSVKIEAPEFTQNCSEVKAMEKLTHEACLIQSNLLNITSKAYEGNSFCYSYSSI